MTFGGRVNGIRQQVDLTLLSEDVREIDRFDVVLGRQATEVRCSVACPTDDSGGRNRSEERQTSGLTKESTLGSAPLSPSSAGVNSHGRIAQSSGQ